MKLSKAQLELLKQFGTSDQLQSHHFGSDIWYTWPGELNSHVNRNTLDALYRRQLIRNVSPNPFEPAYAITRKGKDYLAGLEEA